MLWQEQKYEKGNCHVLVAHRASASFVGGGDYEACVSDRVTVPIAEASAEPGYNDILARAVEDTVGFLLRSVCYDAVSDGLCEPRPIFWMHTVKVGFDG